MTHSTFCSDVHFRGSRSSSFGVSNLRAEKTKIREEEPAHLYVCSPFSSCVTLTCVFFVPQYVPQNLYPVYKNKVVPVADIITPNQFEAE